MIDTTSIRHSDLQMSQLMQEAYVQREPPYRMLRPLLPTFRSELTRRLSTECE